MINRVLNGIKAFFTENIPAKLLALVISTFVWFLVVNTEDPNVTKTYTITVNVINEEDLIEAGKYYDLTNGNTVRIMVSAPRSVLNKLSASDFYATADLNYLENDKRVPVDVAAQRYANQVEIKSKQLYLNVKTENQTSNRLEIQTETVGNLADGYVIDSISTKKDSLYILGRESIISKVDSVKLTVDISGKNSDFTYNGIPVFYDSDGNKLDTKDVIMDTDTVEVSVKLLSVKNVGIEVKTSGELADNLMLDTIVTNPASIAIKGTASALNQISTIVIPEGLVNLSNITADFTTTVNITEYLPAGVALNDSNQAVVTISVILARDSSKDVVISKDVISIEDIPEGYSANITDDTITLRVSAVTSLLNGLDVGQIKVRVNLADCTEGTQLVPAVIEMPEGYTASPLSIKVELTSKSTQSTESTENTQQENDSSDNQNSSEEKEHKEETMRQ